NDGNDGATATATATAAATEAATTASTPAPTAAAVAATPAFPLTITDSAGASVTLDAAPERIISYSPGATEILFAIGVGDRVVATDQFSDYPPETADLPKLTYSDPDPEPALALDPDLVIMAGRQRDQVEQFRSLGMTVLLFEEAPAVRGVLDNIRLIGRLTGAGEDADALATTLNARIDAVEATIADVTDGPVVFFEITADLYTAAPNSFVGDLLTLLHARNVAEGAASPFPQLTAEAVIAANPDVVLLTDAEFGETPAAVCARPGWAAITACTQARVHPVDGDLATRPGPRVVDGLELIAAMLYPDRFR
ncbi:MAG: ABC transporter substrate-binding protein, partial [Dehalococcoidia bacterium]